jgi:hypothetical protein
MEKKTLWIIGGGLALLVILYAVSRSSGGTNTVSVVPASAPADPNVLAAQVQQDSIRGQIALASINAAGTIDAINAQSQGQVNQIDASYKGQGYLAKLSGAILSNLAANQYTAQLGLAQIEGQTATELAQIQSAPTPTTSTSTSTSASTSGTVFGSNRYTRLFALGGTAAGQTPVTTQPIQSPAPKPQTQCWARVHIPILGSVLC